MISIAVALHATQIVEFSWHSRIKSMIRWSRGLAECKPGSEAAGVNGNQRADKSSAPRDLTFIRKFYHVDRSAKSSESGHFDLKFVRAALRDRGPSAATHHSLCVR
jgi:hypothetical protein